MNTTSPDIDELSLLVEQNTAESLLAEAVVPGVEVHADRDVTWIVHPGSVWRNVGVLVRLSDSRADTRLDVLLARYQRHGRGMGLWISPAATPADLGRRLRSRRLRCRKHFPAMVRRLSRAAKTPTTPRGLTIQRVRDVNEFVRTPHPAIGPATTPLRKVALDRLRALVAAQPQTIVPFVAYVDGRPVGSSELFLGSHGRAGLIGLSVLPACRGRGIGGALLEYTCQVATNHGASTMALIATSDGERLYAQHQFLEVARFGYWYRSFQRECG